MIQPTPHPTSQVEIPLAVWDSWYLTIADFIKHIHLDEDWDSPVASRVLRSRPEHRPMFPKLLSITSESPIDSFAGLIGPRVGSLSLYDTAPPVLLTRCSHLTRLTILADETQPTSLFLDRLLDAAGPDWRLQHLTICDGFNVNSRYLMSLMEKLPSLVSFRHDDRARPQLLLNTFPPTLLADGPSLATFRTTLHWRKGRLAAVLRFIRERGSLQSLRLHSDEGFSITIYEYTRVLDAVVAHEALVSLDIRVRVSVVDSPARTYFGPRLRLHLIPQLPKLTHLSLDIRGRNQPLSIGPKHAPSMQDFELQPFVQSPMTTVRYLSLRRDITAFTYNTISWLLDGFPNLRGLECGLDFSPNLPVIPRSEPHAHLRELYIYLRSGSSAAGTPDIGIALLRTLAHRPLEIVVIPSRTSPDDTASWREVASGIHA